MYNNYVPSNLKFLRAKKGLSLKEVAKIMNKSDVTIHYWETGQREISTIDLFDLSNFYNVDIDDILKKDLRLIDSNIKESKISNEEFKNEVINLLDKVEDLDSKEKRMLLSTLDVICGDENNE